MRHFLRYFIAFIFTTFVASALAQTTKWRDMYQVKKKDTIFGIAKKYDITLPELMDANPEMKVTGYELKKGDFIFIPYSKPQVKPANVVQPNANTAAVDIRTRSIRVGVMLPLHDVDGDGRRMIEYYRGILMACDSMKHKGVSTEVYSWNLDADGDARQMLLDPKAKKCDVIFGPLYSNQVKTLGDFCKSNDIKLVIPFSITGDEVMRNSNIYQVYQSQDRLNTDAINVFVSRFAKHHAVFIDCNDTSSKKGVFTFGLRNEMDKRGLKYSITNLKSSEDVFAKAFSKSQPNVVVLNTDRSPELNVALAKINGLSVNYPGVVISLFGYTEWLMYTKYNLDNFFKYDTYIPSTYYYNPLSVSCQRLENNYNKSFSVGMLDAIPKFAITGFDQAMFFIDGLHKVGKSFNGTKGENHYQSLQTPFNFKAYANGGMKNCNFMLIHYTYDHNIESITY
jgi:murein DD-endopeptidase MepM/ murein hydrolase activator NlpD